MTEERKEVKTILVDYKCPECKKGYLRPTGYVYTIYPALYAHKCNKCMYKENFTVTYPFKEYI